MIVEGDVTDFDLGRPDSQLEHELNVPPAPTWKREPTIARYDFEKKAQRHSRTE